MAKDFEDERPAGTDKTWWGWKPQKAALEYLWRTGELTIARPDTDQSLTHIGLVGDTYTILVRGEDTAGRYTLIDMHVPPNSGPGKFASRIQKTTP